MGREKILQKLTELFVKKYGEPESKLIPKNYDKPLTGKIFGFDSIALVYLFFDIQHEFKIHIDAKQILHYEFNTINGIVRLIEKCASQQAA